MDVCINEHPDFESDGYSMLEHFVDLESPGFGVYTPSIRHWNINTTEVASYS
jgi:hypothetical protein